MWLQKLWDQQRFNFSMKSFSIAPCGWINRPGLMCHVSISEFWPRRSWFHRPLLFGAPMNKRNSWSRNVLLDQPNQTRCECHFDHKGIVRTRTYSTHAKVCANGIWLMCPTIVIDILKYDFRNSLKCIVILSHGNFRVILWRLNSTFTYLVLRL